MSNYIKNIAIIGAGGQVGTHITKALLEQGKHTLTAVTRADSTSTIPEGLIVKKVNYEDHEALTEALKGQDALIISLAVTSPPETQKNIITAAAAAKIPWIVPNEYGSNYSNNKFGNDVLLGSRILEIRKQIEELGLSKWVAISCGFWYEYSLAFDPAYGFDTYNKTVTFYSGGETKIPTSTFPQVGRATARLFALPISGASPCLEDWKNQSCYVKSFTVSQKDMFESVKRVTGTTDSDWKISEEDAHQRYQDGMTQLKTTGDRMGFAKLLYARSFYPEDNHEFYGTLDFANEKLGLPEEDIDEFTRIAVETQKKRATA